MTDTTLAVDPGLRGLGAAYFIGPTLVYANYISNPVLKGDGPTAWFALADAVYDDFKTRGYRVDTYVVELMQIYFGNRGGNPNDLLELAGVGGAVGAVFPIQRAAGYRPREWKGTLKKEVHHPRILAELSDAEKAAIAEPRKSYVGHVIDAIGLGLYQLERDRVRIATWGVR